MVDIKSVTEKREELYSLAPFSESLKALKRRLDLSDFAYSNLRLSGGTLSKEGVQKALEGEMDGSAPVLEYRLCEAHRKLLARFTDKIEMDLEVDIVILEEFCRILTGEDTIPYRKGSPLIYHLDYVPGDEEWLGMTLSEIFATIRKDEREGYFDESRGGDFCLKAAAIHNGIVKAYPYIEGLTELAARTAMQYQLVKAGYFTVDPGLTETEYNTMTAEALKTGSDEELAGVIRAAIFKKLEYFIDFIY